VQDTSNNEAILKVNVTVEDNADPAIYYTGLTEITVKTGSTGNNFIVSFTNLYSDTYTAHQDGTTVNSDMWTSGGLITVDLDELSASNCEFTINVQETSNNDVTIAMNVTVSGYQSQNRM